MTQIWYLITSFISVPHIVGSVFGPIRFLLPVCRLCWFLYTLNIYNQLSQQTGSRNLTGPKTLPTIWYTYMKLVTKNQISAINSYWEKCDEKYLCIALLWQIIQILSKPLLYLRSPKGEGGILFYLCPSVLPSIQDIFRRIFLSNCWWQKSEKYCISFCTEDQTGRW
jgi:hypothetical protein